MYSPHRAGQRSSKNEFGVREIPHWSSGRHNTSESHEIERRIQWDHPRALGTCPGTGKFGRPGVIRRSRHENAHNKRSGKLLWTVGGRGTSILKLCGFWELPGMIWRPRHALPAAHCLCHHSYFFLWGAIRLSNVRWVRNLTPITLYYPHAHIPIVEKINDSDAWKW